MSFLRCWPLLLLIGSWVWGLTLWWRLTDFQTDPRAPYIWTWKYFNPNNFTAEGQPLLHKLWASAALFALFGIVAMLVPGC